MKYVLLFGIFGFVSASGYSQQNTVPSGGNASGSNGSVSFTVGQIDYSSGTGSDGSTNEGVQQPFEFFDPNASLQELPWNASLYPNPTNEFIIVAFEDFPENTNYQLVDAQGKLLLSGNVTSDQTKIDMRSFAAGTYRLQLNQSTVTTTSIQIIKN